MKKHVLVSSLCDRFVLNVCKVADFVWMWIVIDS